MVVSAAVRLRASPRAQASQPISDPEKRSRGSRCAVECRATSVRAILALQHLPIPSLPVPSPPPPQAVTRGLAALGSDPGGRSAGLEALGRGRARTEAGAALGWGAEWEHPVGWEGPRGAELPGGAVVLVLRTPGLKTLPFLP